MLNQRLRKPRKTHLATCSAYAEIQVNVDDRDAGPDGMCYASHDVADCFYQMAVPLFLSRFLALKGIKASTIGKTRCADGPVGPDEVLYPCLAVLPMGFSLALHLAQTAHETILRRAGVLHCSAELLLGFVPPRTVPVCAVKLCMLIMASFCRLSKAYLVRLKEELLGL